MIFRFLWALGSHTLTALLVLCAALWWVKDGQTSAHPFWTVLARSILAENTPYRLKEGTVGVALGKTGLLRLENITLEAVDSPLVMQAASASLTVRPVLNTWPPRVADADIRLVRPAIVQTLAAPSPTAAPPNIDAASLTTLATHYWQRLQALPLRRLVMEEGHLQLFRGKEPFVRSEQLNLRYEHGQPFRAQTVLHSKEGTLPVTFQAEVDKAGLLRTLALTLDQGSLALPLPHLKEPLALRGIAGRFVYDMTAQRGVLSGLTANTTNPASRLQADGTLTITKKAVEFAFTPTADTLTHAQLMTLWPATAAPGVHTWLDTNMDSGVLDNVRGRLRGSVTMGGALTWQESSVTAQLRGYTVRYFKNLPAITGAAGTLKVTQESVDIAVTGGAAGDIAIEQGTLAIGPLKEHHPLLILDAALKGPVPSVLRLLEHPDIQVLKQGELDAAASSGQSHTEIALKIPLTDNPHHTFTAGTTTKITDGVLPIPHWGKVLRRGTVTVTVTVPKDYKVQVVGKGDLEGIPADFTWQHLGKGKGSTLTVQAAADSAAWGTLLGIPLTTYAAGPLALAIHGQFYSDNRLDLSVTSDTQNTELRLPELRWTKPAGKPGSLKASLLLQDGKLRAIAPFALTAPNTKLEGMVQLQPAGTGLNITSASLPDAMLDGQPFRLDWRRLPGGTPQLTLALPWLDPRAYIKNLTTNDKPASLPDLDIQATIGQLWMSDLHPLLENTLSVRMSGGVLQSFDLSGSIRDKPYILQAVRETGAARPPGLNLTLSSGEGGRALQALGLYDNMRKGALDFKGFVPDGDSPLTGRLLIKKFKVKNAPVLASILSVASLVGPLDLLSGEGVRFDTLQADIGYHHSTLKISNGMMRGQAIGLQTTGTYDVLGDTLNIRGAVIPAYILTRIVGGIPVLGNILTNNEREGLIAMRYTAKGPAENPSVFVNPLTVLTPGFLRGFFDIWSDNGETDKSP